MSAWNPQVGIGFPETTTAAEELAYALLEEARMRCERLLEGAVDHEPMILHALHRDVGAAGYHCSAGMDPDERQRLLEIARRRSAASDYSVDALRALLDVIHAASRALDHAATVTEVPDYIDLAQLHMLAAGDALEALYAARF